MTSDPEEFQISNDKEISFQNEARTDLCLASEIQAKEPKQDFQLHENFLKTSFDLHTKDLPNNDDSFDSDLSVEQQLCKELDDSPQHWYFGSEENRKSANKTVRKAYEILSNLIDEQKREQYQRLSEIVWSKDIFKEGQQCEHNVFQRVRQFSVGSIKFIDETNQHYIPMFPHLYCNDMTDLHSPTVKDPLGSIYSNILGYIGRDQALIPGDIQMKFFGRAKKQRGIIIPYQKIQIDFKSMIPPDKPKEDQHQEDMQVNLEARKYRLDIKLDNISAIKYFKTKVDEYGDLLPNDSQNGAGHREETVIFIHLKKPAPFFVEQDEVKKYVDLEYLEDLTPEDYEYFGIINPFIQQTIKRSLSIFGLPSSDETFQFLNFWNVGQVICIRGQLDQAQKTSFDVILETLKSEKILTEDVTDLSNGSIWTNIYVDQFRIAHHQNQVIDLAKAFKEKINRLNLSMRLGIYSLYSAGKISIFNTAITQVLDMLALNAELCSENDQKQKGQTHCITNFFMKHALDELINNKQIGRSYPDQETQLVQIVQDYLDHRIENERFNKKLKVIRMHEERDNFFYEHRIIQTPTMLYVMPLQLMQTNLVIRKFKKHKDFFVRLNFLSDVEKLDHYQGKMNEYLLQFQVKNTLRRGIFIGDQQLKYLAYSNSQIKNHSVWLIAEQTSSAEVRVVGAEIIAQLGSFNEQIVLKRNSRIGMAFTTTKSIMDLDQAQIKILNDIESNHEECPFSDGCGNISLELSEFINEKFGLRCCSAYQIRLAGMKGVLVYKPSLHGWCIEARKSMIKFEGNFQELGVVRCATFSIAYLNRQIIMLLSCLGVKNSVFHKLQNDELQNLDRKLLVYKILRQIKKSNKSHQEMCHLVKLFELNFGPSIQFKKIFQRAFLYQYTLKEEDGTKPRTFTVEQEPILSQVINNMILCQALRLKNKTRIKLAKGCVLVGVIDEEGILEEGEIFCQVEYNFRMNAEEQESLGLSPKLNRRSRQAMKILNAMCDKTNSRFTVEGVNGQVLVTKNPCVHPGDIRKASVVSQQSDPERFHKLSHLYNVVVFPSKGPRPLQNMISGGDLDGDVYMVIWDEDIVSQVVNIYEPKDPGGKVALGNQTQGDIVENIGYYLQNDYLGELCNIHTALCDQIGRDGPLDPYNISLADKISIMTDFAKHAKCIDKEDIQHARERCKHSYPDFLNKEPAEKDVIYDSTQILGELYRKVGFQTYYENVARFDYQMSLQYKYKMQSFLKSLFPEFGQDDFGIGLKDHISYLTEVYAKVVEPMTVALKQVMLQNRLINEAEMFCNELEYRVDHIQKTSKWQSDGSKNMDDARRSVEIQLDHIIELFKEVYDSIRLDDQDQEFSKALCVYFGCYFRLDSPDCIEVYNSATDEEQEGLDILWDLKKRFLEKERAQYRNEAFELGSFKGYKEICSRCCESQGASKSLEMLIAHRQIFCVPWLLCYEKLFVIK